MTRDELLNAIEHWLEFGEIGGEVFSKSELLGFVINHRAEILRAEEVASGISESVLKGSAVIPEMTNPLGIHWKQPNRDQIVIRNEKAYVSTRDHQDFSRYDSSFPSGVYPGKMWVRNNGGVEYLVWYDADCRVKYLPLELVAV